jgi:probable F420-dependent oxidoreductase
MIAPLGRWGAWSTGLRLRPEDEARRAAATLEDLGLSALWTTGATGDPFDRVAALLDATSTVTVATGILSIWELPVPALGARLAELPDDGRFLLGLGVSHQQLVDRSDAGRYARPLTRMREYLHELDQSGVRAGARDRRVLAALGPRMLELARDAAAGAHPYLSTPAHTAAARTVLGDGLLAPTQMALLISDPGQARATARRYLAPYLAQPNYRNSWLRQGFTSSDLTDTGSDRLVDALVAWGDAEQVSRRLQEHVAAGADHVCIQLLDPDGSWADHALSVTSWRELAPALAP